MKLRILISILFIIATTVTAVHEIEHLTHEHDSSQCQVCTFDNHSISGDIVSVPQDIELFKFEKITSTKSLLNFHIKERTNQTRAPPLNS